MLHVTSRVARGALSCDVLHTTSHDDHGLADGHGDDGGDDGRALTLLQHEHLQNATQNSTQRCLPANTQRALSLSLSLSLSLGTVVSVINKAKTSLDGVGDSFVAQAVDERLEGVIQAWNQHRGLKQNSAPPSLKK